MPPEIRRAHVCTTNVVGQKNGYYCVSFSDWTDQIKSYYAGGGGINFDFSIEGAEK